MLGARLSPGRREGRVLGAAALGLAELAVERAARVEPAAIRDPAGRRRLAAQQDALPRLARPWVSGTGMTDTSARVYGCSGARIISSVGPISTIRPR